MNDNHAASLGSDRRVPLMPQGKLAGKSFWFYLGFAFLLYSVGPVLTGITDWEDGIRYPLDPYYGVFRGYIGVTGLSVTSLILGQPTMGPASPLLYPATIGLALVQALLICFGAAWYCSLRRRMTLKVAAIVTGVSVLNTITFWWSEFIGSGTLAAAGLLCLWCCFLLDVKWRKRGIRILILSMLAGFTLDFVSGLARHDYLHDSLVLGILLGAVAGCVIPVFMQTLEDADGIPRMNASQRFYTYVVIGGCVFVLFSYTAVSDSLRGSGKFLVGVVFWISSVALYLQLWVQHRLLSNGLTVTGFRLLLVLMSFVAFLFAVVPYPPSFTFTLLLGLLAFVLSTRIVPESFR